MPTRYPGGINTSAPASDTAALPMLDPTKLHVFFDDFDDYDASHWVVTEVDTDTDGAEAVALATAADGGVLSVPTEADELDSTYLQWSGEEGSTVVESFLPAAGKKMWFKTRFKVSDATDTQIVLGLQKTETNPTAATIIGVYFHKADTSTTLNLIVADSAATTTAAATLADDTWVTAAWYYDGKSSIKAFIDGVHVATSATTNLCDEELTISFGIHNGAEGVETLSVDYIFAAKER
jgi:hypothetical protein